MRFTSTAIPLLAAFHHSPTFPNVVSGFSTTTTTTTTTKLSSSWTKPSPNHDHDVDVNHGRMRKSRLFSSSGHESLFDQEESDNASDDTAEDDATPHHEQSHESRLFHVSKVSSVTALTLQHLHRALASGTSMGIATLILTSSTVATAADTVAIDVVNNNAANLPKEAIVELTSSSVTPSTSVVVESKLSKPETMPPSVISTLKDVTSTAETKDASVATSSSAAQEVVAEKTASPTTGTTTTVDATNTKQPASPVSDIDAAKLKAAATEKKSSRLETIIKSW
mmetsp:Transcript_32445/g.68216  ORF Transcript_32445/g.68216 Transcript_32445/m.68216 type:complete len:282 (-) Transcript_32445:782-1627(-)